MIENWSNRIRCLCLRAHKQTIIEAVSLPQNVLNSGQKGKKTGKTQWKGSRNKTTASTVRPPERDWGDDRAEAPESGLCARIVSAVLTAQSLIHLRKLIKIMHTTTSNCILKVTFYIKKSNLAQLIKTYSTYIFTKCKRTKLPQWKMFIFLSFWDRRIK